MSKCTDTGRKFKNTTDVCKTQELGKMAGDWIKIEHTLPDKPEVVRMAMELGLDQDAVAGKLLRIWTWADQNTVAGNDIPVTNSFLDRLTAFPGFAAAMRKVGWLEGREGSLSFPRFDRHNGQTAKLRAETNRRVAKSRAGKLNATKPVALIGNANVTEKVLQKPLPEKRREEVSTEVETIPPNPQDEFRDPELWSLEIDRVEVDFYKDHVAWVAEFIRRWNKLAHVRKHDSSALSSIDHGKLLERLKAGEWYWKRAFTKFPLYLPSGPWQITLGRFLKDGEVVNNILGGMYERTEQAGLFGTSQKTEPGRIRTGATSSTIEQAMAEAAAKRGGSH